MAPQTTFFDLPSEIRNEIYTLIAFHHETGGIISPLGDKHHVKISVGLFDERRYPIKDRNHYYKVNQTPEEKAEAQRFKATTNATSHHFCRPHCLRPPYGASRVCRQMREEVLAIFYGINTFHLEFSNFEITDVEGLPIRVWSPVKWWRAIGDTNLRRMTALSLVCHPSADMFNDVNIMFRYRWTGREAEVSTKRIELLPWEKARRANLGRSNNSRPVDRHPSDMTRFETYRLQKWERVADFESSAEHEAKAMRESGPHVRALERLVAALEPWDVEYLQDHISLENELVVGNVKEGRGEMALKWDFLS